jgi:hypothetical protein
MEERIRYNNSIGKIIMYKSTENDKFLTDRDIQTKVYFTIEAIKDNSNGVIII